MDSWPVLLALVRSAIWEQPLPEAFASEVAVMDSSRWRGVLQEARRQSVTGLVYGAARQFPPGTTLPGDILFLLVSQADHLIRQNGQLRVVHEALLDRLSDLHPLVMKGFRCADRYPAPELRVSGDIDLYFPPESYEAAWARLQALGEKAESYPDGSGHLWYKGFQVDLHRRYYDLHASDLPPVGSPEGELLMLSAHIFKHAVGPGVGLRQLCDLALALEQVPDGRAQLTAWSQKLGMSRWNKLLLAFLDENLSAAPSDSTVSTKPLREILQSGGNFGHYAESRGKALERPVWKRKADTFRRFLSHFSFGLRHAPRQYLATVFDLAAGNLFHKKS